MTLGELIDEYRVLAQDTVKKPGFCSAMLN